MEPCPIRRNILVRMSTALIYIPLWLSGIWAIIGRLPSLFVTQFSSALWSIPFVERLSLPQSPVIAPTIDYCELAVY